MHARKHLLWKAMTSAFLKYQSLLNSQCSEDYWSDVGIGEAVVLLGTFSDADWNALELATERQPATWVVRSAQSMGDKPNHHAMQLLTDLIQRKDLEVATAALDSINSLLLLGSDPAPHLSRLRTAIDQLSDSHSSSAITKMLINSVRSRLRL
jgi:hypothetical protein